MINAYTGYCESQGHACDKLGGNLWCLPTTQQVQRMYVHLPFIEGQPLHQVPPYAWEHWLGLAAAGLPLLCLPVAMGCCWQTLARHVRLGTAALSLPPPMISCLGCTGNFCCEHHELLSRLGLGTCHSTAPLTCTTHAQDMYCHITTKLECSLEHEPRAAWVKV